MDLYHSASASQKGSLFIADVDRIDCAVFDQSLGVIGKSWFVDVMVEGALDSNGFVYDFSILKKMIKKILKESVDHALIIPILSESVQFELNQTNESWSLTTDHNKEVWNYSCPKGAVYPIRAHRITRDLIASECSKQIRHRLPEAIEKVQVTLRSEESSDDTFFCYTHGITGHQGLCQRLFHGHRSKIDVFVNEVKRPDLEKYIAKDLFKSHVHIASRDQILDRGSEEADSVHITYTSNAGTFTGEIPSHRVFLVPHFTSIESISNHLAQHLKEHLGTTDMVRVHCYEGIGKGAIARA